MKNKNFKVLNRSFCLIKNLYLLFFKGDTFMLIPCFPESKILNFDLKNTPGLITRGYPFLMHTLNLFTYSCIKTCIYSNTVMSFSYEHHKNPNIEL